MRLRDHRRCDVSRRATAGQLAVVLVVSAATVAVAPGAREGVAVAAGAAAPVESAPGRVLFAVAGGRATAVPDGAIAVPGGGALIVGSVPGRAGLYVAKVMQTGGLEASFGEDGVAYVPTALDFEQILLQPDGKILLVGLAAGSQPLGKLRWGEPHPTIEVVRLTAAGSVDLTYGVDGVAVAPLQAGCVCDEAALEQGDGALVLTGQRPAPGQERFRWALVRISQAGVLDPSFGQRGIALVPGSDGVGLSLAAGPGEAIVAQGQTLATTREGSGPENLLTRLTPDGALDGTFAHGLPFALPVFSIDDSYGQTPAALESVVEPDGEVVVETFPIPANPGQRRAKISLGLIAYNDAGEADRSFGYGGYVNLEEGPEPTGSLLLPDGDGGLLAIHRSGDPDASRRAGNERAREGSLEVEHVTATGQIDRSYAPPGGRAVAIPFGGGEAQAVGGERTLGEPPPSLDQNSFLPAKPVLPELLAQPDGSYLLAGSISLSTPAEPGASGAARFAVAALTSSLTLDRASAPPPKRRR
jgi:uncharacterized delta-60 repeat protein